METVLEDSSLSAILAVSSTSSIVTHLDFIESLIHSKLNPIPTRYLQISVKPQVGSAILWESHNSVVKATKVRFPWILLPAAAIIACTCATSHSLACIGGKHLVVNTQSNNLSTHQFFGQTHSHWKIPQISLATPVDHMPLPSPLTA